LDVEFFRWIDEELPNHIPLLEWPHGEAVSRTAIVIVDLVRGFCHLGPLASPRVEALVDPVAQFLMQARQQNLQHFWFCCDEHPPDSPEFQSFPPHCIAGSEESQLHPTLEALNLGSGCRRFAKGSLNAFLEGPLLAHLEQHPEIDRFLFVGDCTDLCVFQGAMHLRMLANTRGLTWQVDIVSDLVDTYDVPVAVAQELGILPHPAETCHKLALYQLKLNGCRLFRYSSISA